VLGLLALMVLHESRRPARLDASGMPVPLSEQDRSRWDREAIAEGTALVEGALRAGAPGPHQIEAAISAKHCSAATAAETDWDEIAELYAILEGLRPSAAVRVNRAFAVARAAGASSGLALLEEKPSDDAYADLVKGTLLAELARNDEAIASLERAVSRTRNAHEARQIGDRIERLRGQERT